MAGWSPRVCQTITFYVITETTATCVPPPSHSESFLRSDLWDGVRQKPYKLECSVVFSVFTALLLHAAPKSWKWKIKNSCSYFVPRNSKCFDLYPREVVSGQISPCPSRRQGNGGPEMGGDSARTPPKKGAAGSGKEPPSSYLSSPCPLH